MSGCSCRHRAIEKPDVKDSRLSRSLDGRGDHPHGSSSKEPPGRPCFRPADQSVGGLLGKRVVMNCLLLLAHRPSGDGHKAEACVIGHHSLRLSALGLNHVCSIDRHRVPVGIIHERGRRGAVAPFIVIVNEVSRGNSPEQRNVVGDFGVIRKPLPAILRGCHEISRRLGPATARALRLRQVASLQRSSPSFGLRHTKKASHWGRTRSQGRFLAGATQVEALRAPWAQPWVRRR